MPAATLAGALALAGCGGGGGTPQQMKTPQEMCADKGDMYEWKNGECSKKPAESTPLQLSRALDEAVDELETMSGTGKDSALAKARDASAKARGVVKTQGVSAEARAAAVEAAGYLEAVQDAIEDVEDALDAAGDHATDKQKADAMAAQEAAKRTLGRLGFINRAFDTAAELDKRASDTAKAVRDLFYTDATGDTKFITTFDGDVEISRPGTLEKWPEGAFGRGSAGESGETFAEIFGALVDVPYSAPKRGVLHKGISVEGESPDTTVPAIVNTAVSDDARRHDGKFQGIGGTYVFAGEAASTVAIEDSGKFGEGWYFHPSEPNSRYVEDESADDLAYKKTTFVEWGLWLIEDSNGSTNGTPPGLRLYAGPGVGSGPVTRNGGWGDITGAATSATYEGSATGLSARRTGGTTAAPTYASGHFTADVELKATFGTATMLGGTIDNFQGGSHTDDNWELTLGSTEFDGGISNTEGDFTGGISGYWTADSYGGVDGGSGKRPDGIYGDFVAEFGAGGNARRGDGVAAGVYHTTPKP